MEKNTNRVRLKVLDYSEQQKILEMINSDEALKNTFSGDRNTIGRIFNSLYTAIIKDGSKEVGFIMIVYNGRTGKNEIDLGILTKYRNMGYGTKALELLKDIIYLHSLDVEIQIQKKNKPAIKSVLNNGFVLCRQDKECNYYTIKEDSKRVK